MSTQELTRFILRKHGQPPPLKAYSVQSNLNSACAYYRLVVPFKTMQELGLGSYKIDDHKDMHVEASMRASSEADIHLYYLLLDKLLLKRFREVNGLPRIWDLRRKKLKRRPVMIYDSDDDIEVVDPMNPKFVTLGTHNPDGSPIRRGGRLLLELDGEKFPAWEDGKLYMGGQKFDIIDNWKRLHLFHASVRLADACTVTNEHLAKSLRAAGAKRVYVFPNSVRQADYPIIDLKRNKRQVKILWQGGWSHYKDWYPLKDAIGRVSEKYPHARFLFWGMNFRSIGGAISPLRREHIPWMPFDAYLLKLATIGHDINLAPLANSKFNRAKSAIKWYEASALTPPVPTLAAAYGPYLEIQDRKTGMLYETPEEFEAKLSELIEDATLRKTLAANAKDWVLENRSAERTVPKLFEFYRSVIEEVT